MTAIQLKNVTRGYGNSKVIENMNLSIKCGTINALVGSSGCGKTTMLKIVLGRLVPDCGEVRVFGLEPYSSALTVPGSIVGYAPQEIALYNDLTIGETIKFFATVHGMTKENYKKRKKEMVDLLELPPMSRVVGTLSGGQKRRVSLACALVHSPTLCVLDEPTVGLDPLLRASVINYLKMISESAGVTVLITTHYIEEAKVADNVFLMRNGKILEGGDPEDLIRKYQCDSLEDVFLQLCKSDNSQKNLLAENVVGGNSSNSKNIDMNHSEEIPLKNVNLRDSISSENQQYHNQETPEESVISKSRFSKILQTILVFIFHSWAISKRTLIQVLRNRLVLFMEIFLPAIVATIFFICIGGIPRSLPFCIVNHDLGLPPGFTPMNLGLEMVAKLEQSDILKIYYYNDTSQAIDMVKREKAWGVLEIPSTFTYASILRISDVSNQTLANQSKVHLTMDYTDFEVQAMIRATLQNAHQEVTGKYNISTETIYYEPAVYGSLDNKFLDFVAPGIIGIFTYAQCLCMVGLIFVIEKLSGSLDRLFAYNVSIVSIVLGTLLSRIFILILQACVLIVISIYAFEVPHNGSVFLLFLIIIVNGLAGMTLGTFISSVSNSESSAFHLALGCFFPTLFISGTLWPIKGIKFSWLYWIPYLAPSTYTTIAMRNVSLRGLPFSDPGVYQPFLILLAWVVGLFILSVISYQRRQRNWSLKFSNYLSKFNIIK
ncbi:ABC transporter G family protein [Tieghemostelium lacteum]|uniref:ABC transporter G family protein n=1 Tax=Tieghemostelium lacteum TaxID=361077 RepID=A0A151Z7U9_TIELA|nr:ABC transporter G family protein [Tieghemostelium lacteum]|eukprot:KYQ90032.1 ABC transporter G family protein [Tieghemostelium lacteum]